MNAAQIIFRPRFALDEVAEFRNDSACAAAEAAVARWGELFPASSERIADYEDWHENAAALMAAIDTGLPVFVMGRGGASTGRTSVMRRFNTAREQPERRIPTAIIGFLLREEPLEQMGLSVGWPDRAAMRAAQNYYDNPGFAAFAGRDMAVASYPAEGEDGHGGTDSLVPVVSRLARSCGPDLMLKAVNRPKLSAPVPVWISDADDTAAVEQTLLRSLELALARTGEEIPRFLVQHHISLQAEYRVIVVELEPVAGAACIEFMCPPWNQGTRFHPVVEGRRGDGDLTVNAALVARYVASARDAAQAMHKADPGFLDGAFDFGLKPDGDIALIEVNRLGNFGLYALDYGAFLSAAIRAARSRLTG